MPNRKKPLVIVTRKLPERVETRMRELFDAKLNLDDKPMTQAELMRSGEDRRRAGADRDRPDRRLGAGAGRRQAEADREFRQRRRQYRRRHRASARHHRHQYAGRAHRGHRRHDDGADPRRAAAAVGRRAGAHQRSRMGRLVADLDARPPHLGQAARHHRHGPHRSGGGAPSPRLRPADPLSQPPPGRGRRSRKSSARPIGTRSTRCWRASTSYR